MVGYESPLFTLKHIKKYINHHIVLKPIDDILIDKLWIRDFKVVQNIVNHDLKYSGVTSYKKVNEVVKYLHGKDVALITDTDVISWLLNIRNKDFVFNPSVLSRNFA